MRLDDVLNEFRRRRSTDIGGSYTGILGSVRKKMASGINKFKAISKTLRKGNSTKALSGNKLRSLKKKLRKDLGVSEDGLTNELNQATEQKISILENLPFDHACKELYKWIKTDEINYEVYEELMNFLADTYNDSEVGEDEPEQVSSEVLNDETF